MGIRVKYDPDFRKTGGVASQAGYQRGANTLRREEAATKLSYDRMAQQSESAEANRDFELRKMAFGAELQGDRDTAVADRRISDTKTSRQNELAFRTSDPYLDAQKAQGEFTRGERALDAKSALDFQVDKDTLAAQREIAIEAANRKIEVDKKVFEARHAEEIAGFNREREDVKNAKTLTPREKKVAYADIDSRQHEIEVEPEPLDYPEYSEDINNDLHRKGQATVTDRSGLLEVVIKNPKTGGLTVDPQQTEKARGQVIQAEAVRVKKEAGDAAKEKDDFEARNKLLESESTQYTERVQAIRAGNVKQLEAHTKAELVKRTAAVKRVADLIDDALDASEDGDGNPTISRTEAKIKAEQEVYSDEYYQPTDAPEPVSENIQHPTIAREFASWETNEIPKMTLNYAIEDIAESDEPDIKKAKLLFESIRFDGGVEEINNAFVLKDLAATNNAARIAFEKYKETRGRPTGS